VLLRQVLDSVRPYLISDGGNIEVVSIDMSTRAVRHTTHGLSSSLDEIAAPAAVM
jgi:Fe-S cluster biogenesis protein NfuA